MASDKKVVPETGSVVFDVHQAPEIVNPLEYDPAIHTAESTGGWVAEGNDLSNSAVASITLTNPVENVAVAVPAPLVLDNTVDTDTIPELEIADQEVVFVDKTVDNFEPVASEGVN